MSILRINSLNARRVQYVRISFSSRDLCIMDRLRPEIDTVLQSLSLNGFSIFSLVDYILASYNREDQRIKPLREEMERDIADICIRLLSHNLLALKECWILRPAGC